MNVTRGAVNHNWHKTRIVLVYTAENVCGTRTRNLDGKGSKGSGHQNTDVQDVDMAEKPE